MARTTGDLTKPLGRTISADEAATLRRVILRRLRIAWGTTLAQWASLAAIFGAAIVLDLLISDRPRWRLAIGLEAGLAGLFALIALYQARRLLALASLPTLPVHRAVVAVDGGYAQLHSLKAFRAERLFSWNYGLHNLGEGHLSPEYLWQVDLVRTRRGGPEQYFVLEGRPLRQATESERKAVNDFLWAAGVYSHPD